MGNVQLTSAGKVLLTGDGKVAIDPACCCGGGDACPPGDATLTLVFSGVAACPCYEQPPTPPPVFGDIHNTSGMSELNTIFSAPPFTSGEWAAGPFFTNDIAVSLFSTMDGSCGGDETPIAYKFAIFVTCSEGNLQVTVKGTFPTLGSAYDNILFQSTPAAAVNGSAYANARACGTVDGATGPSVGTLSDGGTVTVSW